MVERQQRLVEAVEIIRHLHAGGMVSFHGDFYDVDTARVHDLPDQPVEIGIAVAGGQGIAQLAPLADHLVAVEPEPDLVQTWNATPGAPRIGVDGGRDGARAVGQIPICWGPDRAEAVERAHRLFRWFGGGWDVNAELPTPRGFASATSFVTPDDVAASIPCGPDLDAIVEAVSAYWQAGFTDVALVQIGDETQDAFLAQAAPSLLERLRAASAAKVESKS